MFGVLVAVKFGVYMLGVATYAVALGTGVGMMAAKTPETCARRRGVAGDLLAGALVLALLAGFPVVTPFVWGLSN